MVEIVVKELPTVIPTKLQTIKTVGKKNFTEMILKPYAMIVGIVPDIIHVETNTPINIKIIIGTIPEEIPEIIPFCISSQENLLILP